MAEIDANPLADLIEGGKHPFPSDMEKLILQINAHNPSGLYELGALASQWAEGRDLDSGRTLLKDMLDKITSQESDEREDLKSWGEVFG